MSTWTFSVLDQIFLLYLQTYPQGTNNLIFAHGEITHFGLLHTVVTTFCQPLESSLNSLNSSFQCYQLATFSQFRNSHGPQGKVSKDKFRRLLSYSMFCSKYPFLSANLPTMHRCTWHELSTNVFQEQCKTVTLIQLVPSGQFVHLLELPFFF